MPWKSESLTDQPTDGCTGVGARDACASKNCWDTKKAPKAPPLASLSQLHVFVFFIYMGM